MPFAAALSSHPLSAQAVGECIGQLLDAHGPHPDLLLVFATAAHRRSFGELCRAARALLQPATLVGATANAVIGGRHEVADQPALVLWAGWNLGGVEAVPLSHDGPAAPSLPQGSVIGSSGWDRFETLTPAGGAGRSVLLFVDPMSFPADDFLARLQITHPALTVIGGLVNAGMTPGDTVLAIDDQLYTRGAVAVVLDQELDTVVSQGCRPIGDPFTVTKADGNLLEELGSRPALTRLQELALQLSPDERELLSRGVHIGRVIDEHLMEHKRGDFLIRAVLGAQTSSGGLVIGDRLAVGDTVQFQLRDGDSAHEDLVELLRGRAADAAVVFTCNGRGRALFDIDDHDADTIGELTGARAVAGLFCAGEVGPVGSRSFLHGFTASVALFRERSDHV